MKLWKIALLCVCAPLAAQVQLGRNVQIGAGGTGGGCSTGGIPTTNGSVTGDSSSTNCGTDNRSGDTASVPANVQTFGHDAGTGNKATETVLIGDTAGANLNPVSGSDHDLIGIGDFVLDCNLFFCNEGIAIGDSVANLTAGSNFIGLGNGSLSNSFVTNTIGMGQGAAATTAGDQPATTADVIALGNGAVFLDSSTTPGDPIISFLHDVIGVGNGAGSHIQGNSHDILGMGDGAGANYATGTHDIVAAGNGAGSGVFGSKPTLADIVALGDNVCPHLGTGSSDVFCLGHGITPASLGAVVNNAIGIGSGITLGSNQTIIGNSSTTQTDIYGTTTIHGAGTINGLDVPGGTDATGTAGHYKMWASTANGCWMFTNGTGSPNCIPTSGGGGTPGGSNTQVQFNNSGSFGGAPITWDGTTLASTSSRIFFGDPTLTPNIAQYNFRIKPSTETNPTAHSSVAVFNQIFPNFGADKPSSTVSGTLSEAITTDAFSLGFLYGATSAVYAQGSGAIGEMVGLSNDAFISEGSSNVTRVSGTDTGGENSGSGVAGSLMGLRTAYANGGTGSATNGYGVLVKSPSWDGSNNSITNAYGVYIEDQDRGTNKFNLYSAGATTQNYFEGIVTGKTYKSVSITDGCATWASNVLGSTGVACGSGGGGVSSFAAPSGSWPSWLVPTVTNSTTTPSLAVAASAIPNSALATQTANTVLGALTATTPSGLAMPSCSGGSNALIWTSGTGFGCNTISAGTGTVTSVAQTVPSWLTVGGSPVTTTGTLAITATTGQTSHQVIGTCGTATSFAPCALVAGDIPAALSSTTSVNGTTIPASVTLTQTIASGTSALGTSAIGSGACATVVTTTATGTATTDVVPWGFNADPTSTTGYSPTANGMLTIIAYPTTNNVNFKVCNNTSASITPGAVTLNWRIVR